MKSASGTRLTQILRPLTTQHVTDEFGLGSHPRRIGAGAGFRDCDATFCIATRIGLEIFLLLLRGRHCHQHVKIGAVRRKGERYDGAPEFFVDGRQRNRGKVYTPKFFRYIKGPQTQFLTFCEERRGLFRAEGRVLAPDLTLDNPGFERHQFLVDKPCDQVLQLAMFLAEFGKHDLDLRAASSNGCGPRMKSPREPSRTSLSAPDRGTALSPAI